MSMGSALHQTHDPNMADAAHENPELGMRLKRIYARKVDKPINLNLNADQPYLQLLERLGNPHLELPPTIHIAGTNGKGSTLAFLQAMLEASGKSVHKLTSPHLIRFNERIVLNGTEIKDDYLIDLLDRIENIIGDLGVTFFEYTTAMAFLAASETPADYLLLETGLGGKYDASNVIQNPLLTMISTIGLDHTEFLGNTVEQIAKEKAGIVKDGANCIIGHQEFHEVYDVIPFTLKTPDTYPSNWPEPALMGEHQKYNALLAATAAKDINIPEEVIKQGIETAKWHGRFELMGRTSAQTPIYYDGGHNPQGAAAILTQIQKWYAEDTIKQIHLIIGIGANKDAQGFIEIFENQDAISHITLVDLPNGIAPITAKDIHQSLNGSLQQRVEITPKLEDALKKISDLTMVCGSLYLYQEVKKVIQDI